MKEQVYVFLTGHLIFVTLTENGKVDILAPNGIADTWLEVGARLDEFLGLCEYLGDL